MALVSLAACKDLPNSRNKCQIAKFRLGRKCTVRRGFSDSTYQLTGVAVAKDNRVFVNYPYWLDTHSYSVVEVKDGKPAPYPDAEWNKFKKAKTDRINS
jgi:hypothetical protein